MKNIDRRQWLKTAGLTSGFTFMGGFGAMAFSTEPRAPKDLNGVARLNSNENPFGPSETVREVLRNSLQFACRYPSINFQSLVEQIAEKEGVSKNHIVVTGGSTEGLKAAGLTFGINGGEIIAADPTFQSLLSYGENFGAHIHRVPVDSEMGHDLDEMERRITSKTGLVFICNPNNPTGTLLEKDKLKDFCSSVSTRTIVFSDEAYYDFITEPEYPSMVELVKENLNVIVSKTFSKVYGLAGLRIGYLVTRPDIATRLKRSVMAMTNVLAIEAAKAALKDDAFYKLSVTHNSAAKNQIYKTLNDLNLDYIKSHTNFVFFKTGRPVTEMITAMEKQHVLIGRPFPPFTDWARISTGTMDDMKLFDKGLRKTMA